MALLVAENIKKNFGKTEVLKGISFSLEKGQVLAIIGSSGSGKTTLLRCLNFLETPDEGDIAVDGQLLEMAEVYRLPKKRRLKRIWIPSVMPFFRSSCTNALGLGWKAGIAAAVLTVPKQSVGRMISEAKLYLMTEELFAWTLTVILLSLLLQKIMLRLMEGRKRPC